MQIYKNAAPVCGNKDVSWFKRQYRIPALIGTAKKIEKAEFWDTDCLHCDSKTLVITEPHGRFVTCPKCGWIEELEELNDVTPAIDPISCVFPITESRNGQIERGCSIFTRVRRGQTRSQMCLLCGSDFVKKFGSFTNCNTRQQRYRCNSCLHSFSKPQILKVLGGLPILKTRLPVALVEEISNKLISGISRRAVSRILKVDCRSVSKIATQIERHRPLLCVCGKPLGSKHWCNQKRGPINWRNQYGSRNPIESTDSKS